VAMEVDTEVLQEQQSDAMLPPRIPSENRPMEVGEGSGTSANAPPRVQQQRHTLPQPPLSALTIDTDRLTQLAMAACAAARDDSSLPPPRALPLFNIPEEETDAAEASP
jgi:hypothetical protein